ncbi:MAG: hypothetical protein ACLGG0_10040 [Bacteriovoracia bacterium]
MYSLFGTVLIFCCLANSVVKAETSTTRPDLIDSTRNTITNNLIGLANRLDSLFGEQRADDELNRSSIRLTYDYRVRMEKKPLSDSQVRFNLRLPNLEKMFRFSVRKNEPTETSTTPKEKIAREKKEEQEEKEPWRFRSDVGLNVAYPPIVFARSRLRKNWRWSWLVQRFETELAWFSDQGVTQEITLFHDHALADDLLFRLSNEQNWLITDKNFSTNHGPSIIQDITDNDAISYNLRMSTRVDEAWYVNNYSVGVAYRRNLKGQWLFAEVGPTLDFPKRESFRRAPSILFQLETLFAGER